MTNKSMPNGGVIASHDVLYSNAWRLFLRKEHVAEHTTVRNFGVCIAHGQASKAAFMTRHKQPQLFPAKDDLQ